jgi:secreted trypsin-like serine protease
LGKGSDKAKFTVVGYGSTLDWPPPQPIDNLGERRLAMSEYQALSKALLTLSQNNATDEDKGGTCSGDSGGPAFWTEKDGTEILVGITSSGDPNCVSTGVYYRTDILDTMDFIAEVIGGLKK